MLWVNELPSIRIRGRASARGTSLTFSSRNPRLLVDSSYGFLPQFMMQVQFGLRTCWPTWSRKKQPDLTLSCFRRAAVVRSPSRVTKVAALKASPTRSKISFIQRCRCAVDGVVPVILVVPYRSRYKSGRLPPSINLDAVNRGHQFIVSIHGSAERRSLSG